MPKEIALKQIRTCLLCDRQLFGCFDAFNHHAYAFVMEDIDQANQHRRHATILFCRPNDGMVKFDDVWTQRQHANSIRHQALYDCRGVADLKSD